MPTYIPHALRQMARRGISRDDVAAVLGDHDARYPSRVPGRECFVRTLGERRLEIVVEPTDKGYKVITAFDQLTED